ncbi:MAG: DUF1592 domain-containing protein [Deltaproteobacteria bacterium]|nr:DUF1592 domain-containing protein [Deltaproteobacteria bacterium]
MAGLALSACVGRVGAPDPGEGPATPNLPGPTLGGEDELTSGVDYWNERCRSCHGVFSGDSAISTGNNNGDFRLDAQSAIDEHGEGLEQYIDATMPFQAADLCRGRCAELTGAYLRSRPQPVVGRPCAPEDTVSYGVRELKLLSSREYQAALEDLLGVGSNYGGLVANNDGERGGFSNMRGRGINGSTLETYQNNAEMIAAAAVANGRPFTCTDASACARRFVDEFLVQAFRGPVSEDQRTQFSTLFTRYPEQGMQLALEAALSSPYFLYRVEAGVDLPTAVEQGYYRNTAPAPVPTPGGAVAEEVRAANFAGGSGRLEGDVWALTENGGVEVSFAEAFADPTVLEVQARGSNHEAAWPELTVRVDGALIGVARVESATLQSYRFSVTGHAGAQRVRLEFNNDSGVPPYGPGQDANLYLAQVAVLASNSPEPPAPPPPSGSDETSVLASVDPAAFVLTPYELASALSFMLTGSTPDAELLAAARNDQLTTKTQLEAQAIRLIDSPRGRAHFSNFVTEWFGLEGVKSASRPDVPELTPAVKAAMVEEVRQQFSYLFYTDGVPFSEFYDGNYTFLNRNLAEYYGVPGNFDDHFVKTEVVGRGGPIASGAFMTSNAHVERTAPILRAVHTRQTALCQLIDPPNSPLAGDDIDEQRAAAQARVNEREAEETVLSSRDFYFLYTDGISACAGCHQQIINPMFGMEDFDHVGRLRPSAGADQVIETIRGVEKEVSTLATLIGVASVSDPTTINYSGAKDLSNKIARTEAVQACLIRKGFRYVTGLTFLDRDLDTGNQETLSEQQRHTYGCVASRMKEQLLSHGESPRAMFIALATENLLRLRR